MDYQTLSHTLPIYINNNSEVLILGSFPSIKSREVGFYYGHKQNRLFLTLSKIFNEEEPLTTEDRKQFLDKHNIALYDVIEECDIEGSSDSSIKDVVPFDIENTLKQYPSIKVIGTTGNKASDLFDKYLKDKINKDIKVIHLPSTSPANAKVKLDTLVSEYRKLFKKQSTILFIFIHAPIE